MTHTIRHKVASSLLPVVEAILAEVTTLGFSGLLLGTLQASSEESWIGQFSERYLGEAGLLFELFDFIFVTEQSSENYVIEGFVVHR